MTNGWTGGQHSVLRAAFGVYLALHFASLVPFGAELFSNRGVLPDASASPLLGLFPNVLAVWDGPVFVTGLLGLGALLAALFALGVRDRWAALGMAYLLACLFGRNPLIANPSLPYVGWMLVAHACLPAHAAPGEAASGPYGSWSARGRIDPDGGWRLPQGIYLAAWVALAVGYGYSGWTKLVSPSWVDGSALAHVLLNPLARPGFVRDALLGAPPVVLKLLTLGALALELAFLPLALWRRSRPWAWLALALMHAGLIVVIDFAELSLGMLLVHAFTFDPAWIRPTPVPGVPDATGAPGATGGPGRGGATEIVFFDSHCGLCHGTMRFVLAEDRAAAFRFAPLHGALFRATVGDAGASLPDSVVVRTADGRLLARSSAILYLLGRLGGGWRPFAWAGCAVPRPFRDAGYDLVAGVRRRLFPRPREACPLAPPGLVRRFDMRS